MATPKDFSPFVPFDLYDFFGYLFPGTIFSISMLFFYQQVHPDVLDSFYNLGGSADSFFRGLALVVCSIVILYTLGHVVATISYIVIDRVLIDGIEGYPVTNYLDLQSTPRDYSSATFKYIFLFYITLIILPALPISYTTLRTSCTIIASIIMLLIAKRIIIMIIHRLPNGRKMAHIWGDRWYFRIYLIPSQQIIDRFIDIVRVLMGMDRKFSPSFIKLYRSKFEQRFTGLSLEEANSENYWLPVFSALTADATYNRTLSMWLHLYGFARNATAALFFSSTLILGHIYYNENAFTGLVPLQIGIQAFLASILGLRYWNLYSHYYTKGTIRAFVELETRPK